jgi:hypothetical protein
MGRFTRFGFVILLTVLGVLGSSCARTPSRTALVTKLRQVNGLTAAQARCVADGLYDGVPGANPPIPRLSSADLRAVAKPDNAGKVSADTVQTLRDVVTHCVPTTANPTKP